MKNLLAIISIAILICCLLVILTENTLGDDEQIYINYMGDDQIGFGRIGDDLEINPYFSKTICGNQICDLDENPYSCITDCPLSGGGIVGYGITISEFYKIQLILLKNKYHPSDAVQARVKITYIGTQDIKYLKGNLTYYLIDNNNKIYDIMHKTISEGNSTIILTLDLPKDANLGYWYFKTYFYPESYKPLVVADTFQTIKFKYSYLYIIFVIVMLVLIVYVIYKFEAKT